MAVKWKWNIAGFAQLRSHPSLVSEMRSAAESAAAGTPFDVVVWPHGGHRTGPRTSVQVWAGSTEARVDVNRDPAALARVLDGARL
jgi:hypothetical protein